MVLVTFLIRPCLVELFPLQRCALCHASAWNIPFGLQNPAALSPPLEVFPYASHTWLCTPTGALCDTL